MSDFATWFSDRMLEAGYLQQGEMQRDEAYETEYANSKNSFKVFYVTKPIEGDVIRYIFETRKQPILFVIAENLSYIAIKTAPDWLRILHAIYYGRVYVWNGENIVATHYQWADNQVETSDPIVIDQVRFEHVESKLYMFPGNYFVAMFNDRVFWKQEQPKRDKGESWRERAKKETSNFWKETFGFDSWEEYYADSVKNGKSAYERQQYSKSNNNRPPTQEEINEAFNRAYNEHAQRVDWDAWRHVSQRPQATGDKWFNELVAAGSLAEAKKKYKQLALEYHPDRNSNGLETMQAINAAWDKAQEYLV